MNFDYSNVDMRFVISHTATGKFFHFQFYTSGYWSSTVGMNSNGFFSSCQMLYPEVSTWHNPGEDEITIGQLFYNSLLSVDSTNTITTYFETYDTRVIHSYGLTLHDLFADKYGIAITLEVDEPEPLITEPDNDFLIMTNFPNSEFVGQPYTQVEGVGADRYIAAYEYINDSLEDFDFADGMETLQRSMQAGGGFPTQCSFLFDPVELEIYIVIKRDFDHIWKVDLQDETIETYQGFDLYRILDIGAGGITADELENITTAIEDNSLNSNSGFNASVYPNPFDDYVTLAFDLEYPAHVVLEIYDITGQKIETWSPGYLGSGRHSYTWHTEIIKEGIYFSKLRINDTTIINKLARVNKK